MATPIKSARSSSNGERWLASGKWRGGKAKEFSSADWIILPRHEVQQAFQIAPVCHETEQYLREKGGLNGGMN